MGILTKFLSLFGGSAPKAPMMPGGDGWSARMGWRYVTYLEGEQSLSVSIEPMATGPDRAYLPNPQAWQQIAPPWATGRRDEILARLKGVAWSRELEWREGPKTVFLPDDKPRDGSIESTGGGQQLEAERLFHPGSGLNHAAVHAVWHFAEGKFARAAAGRVRLFVEGADPNSVFSKISLPALRSNPKVSLDFITPPVPPAN